MAFDRSCPICESPLTYPSSGAYNRACKENRCCKSCSYKKSASKRKISLERMCPDCGTKLIYKTYSSWYSSNSRNLKCRRCSKLGIPKPTEFRERLSVIMLGDGNPMFGKRHTEKAKETISRKNRCNKSKAGQQISDGAKKNMRTAALRRIDALGAGPAYNPEACKFMETLKPTYNFQHALNGGEFRVCGYSVDGYDREKNVIFEYDEPHHFLKKEWRLKDRDIKRMDEIKRELNCTFLRYDERNNLLKEA